MCAKFHSNQFGTSTVITFSGITLAGGVLVVLGNYTGDRLNFGKAIEKAKIAGIKVS